MHKALQLNLYICECLAKMQNNESVMRTGNINLSTQMNVRRLLSPEYVSRHIDIQESPHLIKQETEQWKEFPKKVTSPEVLPTMHLDSGDSVK